MIKANYYLQVHKIKRKRLEEVVIMPGNYLDSLRISTALRNSHTSQIEE